MVPFCLTDSNDGRSPAARLRRSVPETRHKGRPRQHRPHHLALHPDAAAVYDPHGLESHPARLGEIFLDDRLHIPRRNGMQIEHVGNGNPNRLVAGKIALLHLHGSLSLMLASAPPDQSATFALFRWPPHPPPPWLDRFGDGTWLRWC